MSSRVKILLILAILVVLVNDIGVLATSNYYATDIGNRVAIAARDDYKITKSDDSALIAAQEKANREFVNLTGFQITKTTIRVSISIPPRKTLIAQRISYLEPHLSSVALVELPIK